MVTYQVFLGSLFLFLSSLGLSPMRRLRGGEMWLHAYRQINFHSNIFIAIEIPNYIPEVQLSKKHVVTAAPVAAA